jgi:predicted XRE-type DNA-binding protein
MKKNQERHKSIESFGAALGLSAVEMKLVREKKKLIQKLKESRIRKRLSQAEMAALVGTKQPAIARMEAGLVSQVSMDFLLKAALVLDLSVTIRPDKAAA